MSRSFAELCRLLINDVYGDFHGHIFSTLLSHGRLSASSLSRKCHLPLLNTRHGVVVLVQAGLVSHFTTEQGNTFYEANPQNAYYLVRAGRVTEATEKRFGKTAASVITRLLLLGHASIGQLRRCGHTSESSDATTCRNDGNSMAKAFHDHRASFDEYTDSEIEEALRNLCSHGVICRLRQAFFRTHADNRENAEIAVSNGPMLSTSKGSKLKEEIAASVHNELEKQSDSFINMTRPGSNSLASQKRKSSVLDKNLPNSKRLKTADGAVAESVYVERSLALDCNDESFTDSLIVRPNYDRIAIILRNRRLVDFAAEVYGNRVSKTYEAVLTQLEPRIYDFVEDRNLGAENERASQTSGQVDERLLARDLDQAERDGSSSDPRWKGVNGHVNGVTQRLTAEARSQLEILCQAPYNFLSHFHEDPDKFIVEFSNLSIHLRNSEIFRMVSSMNRYAVRIVRILLDKGKVDEKRLQEIALMPAKELRQTIAMLLRAGFVELQEVPREAQRQPSRTMYLWFYDPDRVRRMIVEDTYKSMARCLQRLKVEQDKVRPTIDKAERSDVRDRVEKLLTEAELGVLEAWKRREAILLGELGRLDELIFVLRDF